MIFHRLNQALPQPPEDRGPILLGTLVVLAVITALHFVTRGA